MLLNNEITTIVKSVLTSDFSLQDSPVTFYSKNGLNWIKISLVYQNDDTEIRYAYNGYLNKKGQLTSRDCHAERHRVISNRISEGLNESELGQKINAHFS